MKPMPDAYGPHGGRLMMTSLSALTLEIYYRYLPLYHVETPGIPTNANSQPSGNL